MIPTFNEANNVTTLLTSLENLLEPVLGQACELIVVVVDSPDGTAASSKHSSPRTGAAVSRGAAANAARSPP